MNSGIYTNEPKYVLHFFDYNINLNCTADCFVLSKRVARMIEKDVTKYFHIKRKFLKEKDVIKYHNYLILFDSIERIIDIKSIIRYNKIKELIK
jgi:hypothetical protein